MEQNNVDYRVEVDNAVNGGQGSYDIETGEIVVSVNNINDIGLIAHEMTHVQQILDGELGFDYNGNIKDYTIEDEVEANQVQYDFNRGLTAEGFDVTEGWLRETYPDLYGDLPSDTGSGSDGSSVPSSQN